MEAVLRNDYDLQFNIGRRKVFCFSSKRFEAKYGLRRSRMVIGETCKGNQEKSFARLNIFSTEDGGKHALRVSRMGTHKSWFYRKVGYVCVGEDQYVMLLQSRKPFFMFLSTGIIMLALICVICCTLIGRMNAPQTLAPYNPLPPVDESIVKTEDEGTPTPEPGRQAVRMRYSPLVKVSIPDGEISVLISNPSESTYAMVVELYIRSPDGVVMLAQSGLLPKGNTLERMTMLPDAAVLQEGVYKGSYRLDYYDPNTGERAIVDSWIDGLEIYVIEREE